MIPFNLIPAVEKGVREVLDSGYLAGYPIQDVKVTVYDGDYDYYLFKSGQLDGPEPTDESLVDELMERKPAGKGGSGKGKASKSASSAPSSPASPAPAASGELTAKRGRSAARPRRATAPTLR